MNIQSKSSRGFTLLELLIVVSIIALLSAALYPVFGYFRTRARAAQARRTMDTISMAMEDYRKDFNAYPPDSGGGVSDNNGSQMIAIFLTRVFIPDSTKSEMQYGPYLKIQESQLTDADGKASKESMDRVFLSPLGGAYKYSILKDTINGQEKEVGYVLVDPGIDKKLGGDINKTTGFDISDPKAAADNIFDPQTASLMKMKGLGQ